MPILLTNATADATARPLSGLNYTPGQPISLKSTAVNGVNYGATVTISGASSDGDSFTIRPSAPQSVFKTLADLIAIAETPINAALGTAGAVAHAKGVSAALANVQAGAQAISRVQTSIGGRMNVVDSLASENSARDLVYKETLSNLQEVDYTAAITEMNKHQVSLQAAQKSYVEI